MRHLCLVWSITLLAGCGSGDQTRETSPVAEVHRGLALFAHEVRTFQPCGADSTVWVVDPSQMLWDVHKELAPPSGPGASLFAVVEGKRGPAPTDGFGADYPEALRVTRVLYLGLEGPDCGFNWSGFQYRAVGNEPFWSVDVTAGGLILKRPGEGDLTWPIVNRESDGDRLLFAGSGVDGQPAAELVIEPGPSRDTMSGSYFGLSAELKVGAETYRGRALVGAG